MISEGHARRVLERALAHLRCDEAQAVMRGGKLAVTRFAENAISQNSIKKDYVLSLMVVRNGRVGQASSNRFDDASLKELVARAEELSDGQPPDLLRRPLPGPCPLPTTGSVQDPSVMALSPEEKAELLKEIVGRGRGAKLELAGAWSTGDACLALANSRGHFAYGAHTKALFSITCTAGDGASGWAEQFAQRRKDVDPLACYERAATKALLPLARASFRPRPATVLLEGAAVKSLLSGLARTAFGADALAQGRSCLCGRMGERVMSPLVDLVDDHGHESTPGLPFDFEGSPRQVVRLIEGGVVRSVLHDRQTAHGSDARSTGHAQPYGLGQGPLPVNLRLRAGATSYEDMLHRAGEAVLVTRFWYDNLIDRREASLTGMTRDGTFLLRDGELVARLPSLRYNVRLLDAFSQIEAVGDRLETFAGAGSIGAAMAVPALRIHAFPFTQTGD